MTQCLDVALMPVHELRAELARFEERVISQRDALIKLTGCQLADCAGLPASLESILEVSATTLDVARASIWRYDESRTVLDCVDLFEVGGKGHSSGLTLDATDYPGYFAALATADVVAADDAKTDPRTREFADGYLQPLGIQSMLDAPLHIKGRVDGVVCFEHTVRPRIWTSDEKSFVIAVSNLISLAFERCGREQAESTLGLQAAALNSAADAMVITDREGTLVWVNPAFTQLTGYPAHEALGRNPRDLLKSGVHDAAFYDVMWATLLNGQVWRGELTNRRKDGATYVEGQTITPVRNGAGEVTHYVAIKRDLTEPRRMEAQFLQAQKMEVVGRLAGGIAHDFNNLITVINGTAELALMDLAPQHPLRGDFERIKESGLRAASLTRQLLSFSRRQIASREPIDIGHLLTDFRGMLQRLIGEDITLIVKAQSSMAAVAADPSQIEQVILNLAVNARDAMPRGGQLTIEASQVELDAHFAAAHPGVKAGPHLMLAVTDTGTGMSPATLSRVFEPFFTTKEPGKGTGLGLATVYAIVQQTGGAVWVESSPGEGSTFRICLPVSGGGAIAQVAEAPPAAGHETVLLVEDDASVRDLATRILQSSGYTVLSAFDAVSALERLRSCGDGVALIVTDVVLPGLSGRALAEQAQRLRPGIPVLYTSGYTDDTVLAHGVAQNTVHYIGKPFTVSALTNKIRDVLRKSSARGAR
jgi:two-component system cell cycle sensor histidine kinase/response regulator CckA